MVFISFITTKNELVPENPYEEAEERAGEGLVEIEFVGNPLCSVVLADFGDE